MNKHLIRTGLVIALVAMSAFAVASDDDRRAPTRFRATLSGYQETPQTLSTAGSGTFKAELLKDAMGAMTIDYELTYGGLEGGTAFAAHIHLGARATTGGVSAFLCGGATTPTCPPTGGTVTGTIHKSDVVGPTTQGIAATEFDELVRALRAGATYANVHTTPGRPGGEIRGQIMARGDDDDN
jgi:hypothetical protein